MTPLASKPHFEDTQLGVPYTKNATAPTSFLLLRE